MSRVKSVLIAGLPLVTAALLSMRSAAAEWGLNLPPAVTPIGAEILNLHNLIMLICAVIFVVVFSVMFYSIYAHRKSKGYKASRFSHSTGLEIVWSAIPALILIVMAVPSTATLIKMEDTEQADMTVKITGYQWLWEYEYLDHDVGFYSRMTTPSAQINNLEPKSANYLLEVDNPLVVPVGKKVRLLVTSDDVIHSWWVPQLGVKKDAIPGYVNETWALIEEEGTYRGKCTELCGKDHGFMPVVVKAVSQEEFDQWVAAREAEQDQGQGENQGESQDQNQGEGQQDGQNANQGQDESPDQQQGQGSDPESDQDPQQSDEQGGDQAQANASSPAPGLSGKV